jgi:opacity protein-like surface antigen
MNKRGLFVCLAAIVLAGPSTSWAQVGGGIKAGINLANVKGFNDAGTDPSQRTGLIGGVFMTFGLAPVVAIQPEVLFSMQGSKLHFTSGSVDTDATAKIDYIQVPVLLRLGNSGGDKASIFAVVGPTLGILVNASQEGVDFKDDLKKTQVGMAAGVGVTLTRFLAEARYTFDLTDFNKPAAGDNRRNRVISFMVGVVF